MKKPGIDYNIANWLGAGIFTALSLYILALALEYRPWQYAGNIYTNTIGKHLKDAPKKP